MTPLPFPKQIDRRKLPSDTPQIRLGCLISCHTAVWRRSSTSQTKKSSRFRSKIFGGRAAERRGPQKQGRFPLSPEHPAGKQPPQKPRAGAVRFRKPSEQTPRSFRFPDTQKGLPQMLRIDNVILNKTVHQAWQRQIKSPREAKSFSR